MNDAKQEHAIAGFTGDLPNDFPGLILFLQQTAGRISQLIDGLSDSELRYRNSDAEFSALENICHLRDLEIQGYTPRIKQILDETVPALPDFDGARVAAESNYNEEQPEVALKRVCVSAR